MGGGPGRTGEGMLLTCASNSTFLSLRKLEILREFNLG